MRLTPKLLVPFLIFIIFACSRNEKIAQDFSQPTEQSYKSENSTSSNELENRKLIKKGKLSFGTNSISKTKDVLVKAVKKHKAYISLDEEYISGDKKHNKVVVRVPSNSFDAMLRDATIGVEKFDFKEINISDVTEEYLDVEARVKTKKELENRFIQLLEKANTVEEILEIEKQIAALRADIESIEGRLKFLQNQIGYSTLTLNFYEGHVSVSDGPNKFIHAFHNGWEALVMFFVILTSLWPFILIGVFVFILFKRYTKRKAKK